MSRWTHQGARSKNNPASPRRRPRIPPDHQLVVTWTDEHGQRREQSCGADYGQAQGLLDSLQRQADRAAAAGQRGPSDIRMTVDLPGGE